MTKAPSKRGKITLAALTTWLKKQNPETTYYYTDSRDCLAFRFIQAQGYDVRMVGSGDYSLEGGDWMDLPNSIDEAARLGRDLPIASVGRTSYGQVLQYISEKKRKKKE